MIRGFWEQIYVKTKNENRPIYTLAPMADVTDIAFRTMIAKYGKPDVMWTEFVSCNGLMSAGREHLIKDLEYGEGERPIVAQLFTSDALNMEGAARLCMEMGYDGIDINMGCPVDLIGKQGAGAALIKNPELAKEIIRAAQRGVGGKIPVSVKTRLGYNKIEYKAWLKEILSCDIPVLTLHLRTKKEMSLVPAHYELIDEISDYIKELSPETIFIINGDIKDVEHSVELYNKYKFDGVMIGRGMFGTPWLCQNINDNKNSLRSIKEKLIIMLEHTKLFEEKLSPIKSFAIMKKHYKAYVNGFEGAKELREKLFEAKDYNEVKSITNNYLDSLQD